VSGEALETFMAAKHFRGAIIKITQVIAGTGFVKD
jgi:hypothetical protein